jgi:hAT family C-terminal dimerisation region
LFRAKKVFNKYLIIRLLNKTFFQEYALIPCAGHNINLIVNDGFKLTFEYSKLISRISTDIVNKSKVSTVIAAQLRELDKKLNKKNVTRWNSVLFMIRSVNAITKDEMDKIRSQMTSKTKKDKERIEKFNLSKTERDMLVELQDVLELFEYVTDELQGNKVNISRVYPAIQMLKRDLLHNLESYTYTKNIRKTFYDRIIFRFTDEFVEQECFVLATFLDPNFALDVFPVTKKTEIRTLVKKVLKTLDIVQTLSTDQPHTVEDNPKDRQSRYIYHREPTVTQVKDTYDEMIDDYLRQLSLAKFLCPLTFWRSFQDKHPQLAQLAHKYLGVQASSAACERMFNFGGHINSEKRRKIGVKHFCYLVYLKLNENLLLN